MKATTVFAHSIRFLKDEAIKVIRQRTGDDNYNTDDIQWVLTVPAIWTPKAKQFMREAAYEVGNTEFHARCLMHCVTSYHLILSISKKATTKPL